MISITLPSIYPEALQRTLVNIKAATRGRYEVIVVAPFRLDQLCVPDPESTKWLPENPGARMGCAIAHHRAAAVAKGNYLLAFADDHALVDGWDVIAMDEFHRRRDAFTEYKLGRVGPFALGLRHVYPRHVGTEFGIYYPYFPLMDMDDVREFGWIGPDYRSGFGDSDLGMRLWHAGGRCEFSRRGLIVALADDGRKAGVQYTGADMALFLKRWGPIYGQGWRTDQLRDFNRDIVPEINPDLAVDNSIFHNDPDFIVKIRAEG